MGKCFCKAGTGSDLEKKLRQVDAGEPTRHLLSQLNERRRFFQFVERAEEQLLFVAFRLEANGGIVRQPRGHRPICAVQFGGQGIKGWFRIER
jgi:hypothetical protein